ncbi:beta-phosphoglucomutase [Niveispirillum fermenti]|uniref:beta-phosphoglucomutase n=1 Tax=Niveispirillum fermenti TaxID=1233113 RepID=UPI003A8623FA
MAERLSHVRAGDVRADAGDGWTIRVQGFDPATAARDESLFALANGALGVRGGVDGIDSATDGAFLAAFFEQAPIHYHEKFTGFAFTTDTRVPVADAKHIRVVLNGETVGVAPGPDAPLTRELDLATGRLRTLHRFMAAQGGAVEIATERLVSFARPGLLALRLTIRSIDYTGPVTCLSDLRWGRRAEGQGDDPRIGVSLGSGGVDFQPILPESRPVAVRQTARLSRRTALLRQDHVAGPGLTAEEPFLSLDSISQAFHADLAPGGVVTLVKFAAYAWADGDRDNDGAAVEDRLMQEAAATLQSAKEAGWEVIAAEQADDLARFWADADVVIEGDAGLQQAIRFNLFHLYQSTGRDGATSIAAKGLTGEGYEGHYFWDTETFILPVLAFTAPQLARRMLEYRIGRLDRARAHARGMGHRAGALFPWRTIAGDECSAHYPSGSAQYHINADIAFATRLYEEATGDSAFLYAHAAEMLFETARIWPQVGHFNARKGGAFTIHEVTGPDEYTALVNNNFYTNAMAAAHLAHAADLYRRMETQAPAELATVATRIGLTAAEVTLWARAAAAMYLPTDPDLGVSPQDDDFLSKPVWPFADTPADRYPLLLHYHPLAIYRHQVCKQADVVLAMLLAGNRFDRGLKQRNFDYYEAVTVHDSTLSPSTYGILAAELGDSDKAIRYFTETARIDLDDLHGNASHGVHMAAMAGSWLGVAWGFGGMRWQGGELRFAPVLPPGWARYEFGIRWRGRRLRVAVDAAGTTYCLLSGDELTIHHHGGAVMLAVGSDRHVAAGPFPAPVRALIFDLDGVLTDTAEGHYQAWQRLADELGVPFDRERNEALKGIDRMGSLERILAGSGKMLTAAEKLEAASRKNGYYQDLIARFTPEDLFEGVRDLLLSARQAGLKLGVASASRNAPALLTRLGIIDLFDHVADAGAIPNPKPAPDIFLSVARALDVPAPLCLGIEDSMAGITAIRQAGMPAVGIGDPAILTEADAVIGHIRDFRLDRFVRPA